MSFKKDLDRATFVPQQIDVDTVDVITYDDAKDILDNINSVVYEIKEELDKYRNLTEINDIYEMVDKLYDKL